MENILELKNVSKKYADFELLNINFNVLKGSILGLIGSNGAGKTTTIKLILNLIKRNSGDITIFGLDNIKNEKEIKENIGIVFNENCFHQDLKPFQINNILKNIYKVWESNKFYNYLSQFQIPKNKTIKTFSTGMKMKLSLAAALSHPTKLLILDEPTSGLDPVIRNEILDILLEYIQDEEKSIILSSHITSDLEKISDYIVLLNDGKIEFNESKESLLEHYKIIKGTKEQLKNANEKDFISIRISQFSFEALIYSTPKIMNKYKNFTFDKANIEDIMLFFARSDKIC